ncbi:interferon-induced protein 44 isoform X2 [Hypomesus transpacificus]|uniref:interferon-induced protein 44 isoform X2 n=1 Tax=Hypomesus transpacificus TaxID=137520 RepID=UPI001F075E22|nr:interferon-induced protein 44 isoform X2 [Hypomesus transpacificus]
MNRVVKMEQLGPFADSSLQKSHAEEKKALPLTSAGPSFNFGMAASHAAIPTAVRIRGEEKKTIFKELSLLQSSPWREVEWSEDRKDTLMEYISCYKPSCEGVSQARVLLLGPFGAGKSSFISSVQSAFSGRVTNRATVGNSSASFSKKLQSYTVRLAKSEQRAGLTLCDIMGLGEGGTTGLTLHDTLAVIKGHAPEGHKFSPEQPVRSETVGYVKKPLLKDKVHCVVFVVDASKISTYPKSLSDIFQQLRDHISDLGVHQVALLTHVDKICPDTARDITQVYKSMIVHQTINKAGALLGMSTSYIVPVKNYSSELDLNKNTDILLLSAVDHILQYVDLYFQDNDATESVSTLTWK